MLMMETLNHASETFNPAFSAGPPSRESAVIYMPKPREMGDAQLKILLVLHKAP